MVHAVQPEDCQIMYFTELNHASMLYIARILYLVTLTSGFGTHQYHRNVLMGLYLVVKQRKEFFKVKFSFLECNA